MIFCKELNASFATKELLFAALKAAKADIVALKKAAIKESDSIIYTPKSSIVTKSDDMQQPGDFKLGDHLYPVINSCMIMDSHSDVHLDGIWNKSVSQQAGKIYYIINHDLEIGKVIAYPKDVEMMIQRISWRELNQPYEGDTECLVFKARTSKASNEDFIKAIEEGYEIEGSVRMQYVDIQLAMMSNDPDYAEENALFNQWLPKIVNKEAVIEQGYYWPVSEAKIYKEGSAVLCGSNSATPQNRLKRDQPPTSTDKTAPLTSTQKKPIFVNTNCI